MTRFDARARSAQRDALRALEDSNPEPESPSPDWAKLLQRHSDGDPAAFKEFLASITPENALEAWEALRGAKLSPADRRGFYEALGRAGGGDVVRQLIDLSDRDAALAVRGWAQMDPAGALDWFRQLDVHKDPRMRQYLADGNLIPEGFLDQVSASLLDSMRPAPNAPDAANASAVFAEEATRLVESLLDQNPKKGEAMMRELTERFLGLYDTDTVTDWFIHLDNPVVQSAAIQRIIEAGAFKDNPFGAVDMALTMQDPKSRGNALSAAFGQLGGGAGGIDPGSVAAQLNAMPEGRDKDFAINGFAHGLAGSAPESALEWAGAISQEGFRETVVRNITRRIGARSGPNGD